MTAIFFPLNKIRFTPLHVKIRLRITPLQHVNLWIITPLHEKRTDGITDQQNNGPTERNGTRNREGLETERRKGRRGITRRQTRTKVSYVLFVLFVFLFVNI